MTPSFATLVNVFKHHVQVYTKGRNVEDSIIVLCQATLARRQRTGKLQSLGMYCESFSKDILDNTTIFDMEMIHIVANHMKQPALTEAMKSTKLHLSL